MSESSRGPTESLKQCDGDFSASAVNISYADLLKQDASNSVSTILDIILDFRGHSAKRFRPYETFCPSSLFAAFLLGQVDARHDNSFAIYLRDANTQGTRPYSGLMSLRKFLKVTKEFLVSTNLNPVRGARTESGHYKLL